MVKERKGKKSDTGKFLKNPKIDIESVSAKKIITQGAGKYALVREGRTGYFKDEYERDMKWLS